MGGGSVSVFPLFQDNPVRREREMKKMRGWRGGGGEPCLFASAGPPPPPSTGRAAAAAAAAQTRWIEITDPVEIRGADLGRGGCGGAGGGCRLFVLLWL